MMQRLSKRKTLRKKSRRKNYKWHKKMNTKGGGNPIMLRRTHKKRMAQKNTIIKELKDEVKELNKKIDETRAEVQQYQDKYDEMKEIYRKHLEVLARAAKKGGGPLMLKKTHKKKLAQKDDEIKALRAKIPGLKQRLANYKSQLTQWKWIAMQSGVAMRNQHLTIFPEWDGKTRYRDGTPVFMHRSLWATPDSIY